MLKCAKHVCPLTADSDPSCRPCEAYFGSPVALWADNTAQAGGQQPADRELQEGEVLPEEADGHQREQTAVCKDRQRAS